MILAYLEHSETSLPKSALVTISAALAAKAAHGHDKAVGLLLGQDGVADAAKQAANYGLDEVVYISHQSLATYLALPYQQAIQTVCAELSPTLVLSAANTRGKDLMPRVAQALDAGQASDILAFVEGGLLKRPMFAGNILAEVEITTDVKVGTVRTTAFDPAVDAGSAGSVREIAASIDTTSAQQFVSFDTVESARPELTEAEAVVSGGRAMKSAENFDQYIAPLADALGAAIGASRAAVDSGYAPNDWQVGQTGKVVAPNLYIAIGISGAIQHLAGMKDSKVIVAINTDPEAPIFEIADYGLVADLYEAVPELTEKIKQIKS